MLELMWIHDAGPESWDLDILDRLEVRLGDRRLELLQMSCHVPGRSATSPATLPSFELTIA